MISQHVLDVRSRGREFIDITRDVAAFVGKQNVQMGPLTLFIQHTAEGPDDMPSHVQSALTQTQLSIPIRDGKLMLGTWQAMYVYEHHLAPHTRHVVLHCTGA